MAKQMAQMTREEEYLNKIHEIALSDDHMMVRFRKDNELEMAREVIKNMQSKLTHIAELAQIGLGD